MNCIRPIAMSDIGTFMVAWTAVIAQINGVAANSVIVGRMFNWNARRGLPDGESGHRQQHRVPSQRRIAGLHPSNPEDLRSLAGRSR